MSEPNLEIETVTEADYHLIGDLFREGFGIPTRIPDDYVSNLCYSEPDGCFVGRVDGEPVGYVTVHRSGTVGYIGNLAVRPAHRKRGYGRQLVATAKSFLTAKCDVVGLATEPDASQNIRLYKSLGFVETLPCIHVKKDTGRPTKRPDSRLQLGSDIQTQEAKFVADISAWSNKIIRGLDLSRDLQRFIARYPAQILFLVEAGRARGFMAYHDHFRTDPWGAVETSDDSIDLLSALVRGTERLFEFQPRQFHIQTNFTKLLECFTDLGYSLVDEKTAMVLSEHRDSWLQPTEAMLIRPWWS